MKDIYIINPNAGKKGATQSFIENVESFHRTHGGAYEIRCTAHAGHGEEIARSAAKSGEAVRLWAVGGDGTFLEVARGAVYAENAAVGVFPRGSGNDFVRLFGDRAAFLDFSRQQAARAVPIDMIRTGSGDAVNICSLGFDARVADRMVHFRRLPFVSGSLAYILSLIVSFFGHLSDPLEITLENAAGETERFSGEYMFALAGNGRWYGGGFCGAPKSRLADGKLDFVLVNRLPLWRIPTLIGKYKRGEHLDDKAFEKYITYRRGPWIEMRGDGELVSNMDGNCVHIAGGERFELLSGALRFLVPAGIDKPDLF